MDFAPDALVTLAGVVLSLVFAYLPWVKDWYEGLDSRFKPLFMVGLLLVVTAGKVVYDCQADIACLGVNWQNAFWSFVTAVIANQTTFAVGVKQIKQPKKAGLYAGIKPWTDGRS